MSDFAAVAPPQSGNFESNSAFADALQRARQIASKIKTTPDSSSVSAPAKRPLDDTDRNPAFGAQLAALQQQRLSTPINAMAMVVEDWDVPDKMVGLIIGRGGEQIGRLQAESSCKIQMAADSGGHPNRTCTLTGTRQAIEKAKDMINQIINRGAPSIPPVIDPNHLPDGHTMIEMLIPGGKVGLVIGKGGETIRNLQERAGVKMVMIQDGPSQSMHEKPLRITGEPQKCEYAKQLVMDLITEKELEVSERGMQRGGWQPNSNEYGSGGSTTQEVMVPRQAVGVVIGKQGDMIKRIQQETGAKVQFQMGKEDGPNDRVCMVTGSQEQCGNAAAFITDLIQSVLRDDAFPFQSRDQQIGRGRGRGRGFEGPGGMGGGPMGGGSGGGGGRGMGGEGRGGGGGGPRGDMPEVQYTVPANKCGLVIGKGGETIRNINQQSGAHVELSRGPPPSPHEKVFVIRGSHQQIEHAQQLINERVNGQGVPSNGQSNGSYGGQYQYQQQSPTPSYAGGGAAGGASQNWNNGSYQSWQSQGGGPPQPAQQPQGGDPADANSAAWAAYYAQYYPQGGQPVQQAAPTGPTGPSQQAVGPAPGANPAGAQGGGAPGGGAGQPDYSAAWAEYYRSLGMYREAEMIEQQARANQQQAAQGVPGGYSATPHPSGAAPPTPGSQQSAAPSVPSQNAPPGSQGAYGTPGGAPAAAQWGAAQPQAGGHPQQGYPAGGYNYSAYGGQQ